jgi:hypothetical protein
VSNVEAQERDEQCPAVLQQIDDCPNDEQAQYELHPELKGDLNVGAWNPTQNDEILHMVPLLLVNNDLILILHVIAYIATRFYKSLCLFLSLEPREAVAVHDRKKNRYKEQ